jgi:hypothetical protein
LVRRPVGHPDKRPLELGNQRGTTLPVHAAIAASAIVVWQQRADRELGRK